MLPNLERIPAVGDQKFLAAIGPDVTLDLARFGVRQTTLALRPGSIEVLTDALWATALGAAVSETDEERDLMIGLVLPHVVASGVGSIQQSSSPRSPTAFPTLRSRGHSSSLDHDKMST